MSLGAFSWPRQHSCSSRRGTVLMELPVLAQPLLMWACLLFFVCFCFLFWCLEHTQKDSSQDSRLQVSLVDVGWASWLSPRSPQC